MTIGQIIALVRALEDVIKADDEQRIICYGTRYREVSGEIANRIVEELYKLQ